MYKLTISIKEILERKITRKIDAQSLEEAQGLFMEQILDEYKNEKIILDADDFVDVVFEID